MLLNPHIALGPLAAFLVYVLALTADLTAPMAVTLAVTALTAWWWVTEALPIPASSLVPFVLFPLFGILDHKAAASALGSHVILLLMGAFMLSRAIEGSGVHKRLALYMVRLCGASSPRRLLLGFMLASALLSMWISNTATTLMLLPIALAVMGKQQQAHFGCILLLGIAYAASLGGIGTLIGTPPNVIFASAYQALFGSDYGFLRWMTTGLVVVGLGFPIMFLWLGRGLSGTLQLTLPQAGGWQPQEKRVLAVFILAALAWMTRQAPWGGWQQWLDLGQMGDSTVALLAVVLLFLLPSGRGDGKALLDWQQASRIPWGMLLLFAGGIVIAKAFVSSGLADYLGQRLTALTALPPLALVFLLCLSVSLLTEITSNTATASLLMPILASAATATGMAPQALMIPAAVSASCAFMLPVATAPNAIVYGTGKIPMAMMIREGMVLNLLLATSTSVAVWWTLAVG